MLNCQSHLPILLQIALPNFKLNFEDQVTTSSAIREFCFDRLSVNLRDQGASPQEVEAVLSQAPAMLSEIPNV
jgi:glycyl-tRNA synthetase beta chain